MVTILVNKVLIILFWLAICNIIRNLFFVFKSWIKSNTDQPEKLVITSRGLLYLGLSIAFVLMAIQNGIGV